MQIFSDNFDICMNYLSFVANEVSLSKFKVELITQMNVWHRLLECMLHKRQMSENKIQMSNEIMLFIKSYEVKIDKEYVMFLFQIYNFLDGVKIMCEKLNLR